MDKPEPVEICGVCAALMREAGVQLRQVPGRTQKATCSHCGKRRFGAKYIIGKGDKQK